MHFRVLLAQTAQRWPDTPHEGDEGREQQRRLEVHIGVTAACSRRTQIARSAGTTTVMIGTNKISDVYDISLRKLSLVCSLLTAVPSFARSESRRVLTSTRWYTVSRSHLRALILESLRKSTSEAFR